MNEMYPALVALGLFLSAFSGAAAETLVTFDNAKTGALPEGWSQAVTGEGTARWTVETDDSAPSKPRVLKQSAVADYPLAIKEDAAIQDGFAEVSFKALSGEDDQAGGLVWRYRDPGNYYLVRANALENNVVLYKVENGKRKALEIVGRAGGYGVKVTVPAKEWNTLRVEFRGTRHTVWFNGKQLFAVENDLFKAAGKVGLWTKADSVTLFDNFRFGQ